jgi:iron complex outermembrane receptor protein
MTAAVNRRRARATIAATAALAAGLLPPLAARAQELSEIIVTGRRQGEEKLKEVPVAITAFDSNAIEAAGISSLGDVANLTPGLSFFNAFGENLPVPVIRGIVPQDIFGENATAIFVDGVYVSGREGLNFNQLDVERIEVLKGPQSAAYGRNAFAGAINYVTKAPSDEFESRAEVESGNRGKQRVLGMVTGPILGDALTGRLSAMYDTWDGSYDNSLAPDTDIGGYRYRSLQGKLHWTPTDSLDVNLGMYLSNDEIDEPAAGALPANCEDQIEQTAANENGGGPYTRLQNYCGRVLDLDELPKALLRAGFPLGVPDPNSITDDSMPKIAEATGEDRDLVRGNLNIAWELDFGTLSFLTGYSDTEQNSSSDFGRSGGNTIPFVYCNDFNSNAPAACQDPTNWSRAPMGFVNIENGETTEEWSQEIRFTSPRDQRLTWSAGGYYYNVDNTAYPGAPVAVTELPEPLGVVGAGPVAAPTTLAIGSYIFGPSLTPDGAIDPLVRPIADSESEGWSVFGAANFDITESLQLNAEIRYSEDDVKANSYDYFRCTGVDGDGNVIDPDTFPFNSPDPACGDDYFDLRQVAPIPAGFVDSLGNLSETGTASADFDSVTGRVGLNYKLETGWMIYGSIAHGEKPGGVQLIPADLRDGGSELLRNTFDQEKITTYEVGLKGFTADQRVGLDFAVFYSDWTDIVLRQLNEFSPVTGAPLEQPTGLNVNAGDADVWGWEALVDVAFTDNLTGRLTVAFTDSTLKNAKQDSYSLFPTFYTDDPTCTPEAIQAITGDDDDETELLQNQKAGQCRKLSGDLSGNTQMRQPEWTSSASLDYRRAIEGDWEFFSRVDANYLGKIYVGNENQSYLPSRENVNLRLGFRSPKYEVAFWVRNLFENNSPIAAFRDIYWTNTDDIQAQETPQFIQQASNFDDFPPFRLSVTYPSLRTFGLTGKMYFGGDADQ